MQISYVNVFVADLEKATEFYRDSWDSSSSIPRRSMATLLSRQVVFDSGLRCRGMTTLDLWDGIPALGLKLPILRQSTHACHVWACTLRCCLRGNHGVASWH